MEVQTEGLTLKEVISSIYHDAVLASKSSRLLNSIPGTLNTFKLSNDLLLLEGVVYPTITNDDCSKGIRTTQSS